MTDATPDPANDDTDRPADPTTTDASGGPGAPDLADAERSSTDPAFDIDLDPEDQGTAEAASEPSG